MTALTLPTVGAALVLTRLDLAFDRCGFRREVGVSAPHALDRDRRTLRIAAGGDCHSNDRTYREDPAYRRHAHTR